MNNHNRSGFHHDYDVSIDDSSVSFRNRINLAARLYRGFTPLGVKPRVQLLHSIQIIAKQKGNLEHTYMYPTTDHYSYTHVTQTEGRFVPLHHLAGTTYSKAIVGDDLAEFGLSLGAYICIIPHRAPTEK